MDREKVIKGLEDSFINQGFGYMDGVGELYAVSGENLQNAIALLKEQDNEAKRIMKIIWDTLHEGVSIDTVPDQDWVYELIRHRIEDR